MKHIELRHFLFEANREKLSPAEKDVFLYYRSRIPYGKEWVCPDSQTANEIGRSRNSVCEARNGLKRRGWIAEHHPFEITILRSFPVGNSTENKIKNTISQSETRLTSVGNATRLVGNSTRSVGNATDSVGNSTRSVGNATDSVGNSTAYKDKRILKSKEEKRERKASPPAQPRRKGTRLPDRFLLTTEMREYAARKRPGVDVVLETEKFCNYFRSAAGAKGVKLDWGLTWKNWILNAYDTPTPRNGASKPFFDPGRSDPHLDEIPEAPVIQSEPLRPRPDVPVEQRRIWDGFQDGLRRRYSADVLSSWFGNIVFDGLDTDRRTLRVRGVPVAVEWIQRYYIGQMHEILGEMGMGEFTFEWTAEGEQAEVLAA